MTNEEVLVQLVGRVATLEHLVAQTMLVTLIKHPNPGELLSVLEETFDGALDDLEAVLPEARPAAAEAGTRIFSQVRNELG